MQSTAPGRSRGAAILTRRLNSVSSPHPTGSAKAMSVPSSLSQSAINANSHGGPALSLPLPLHAAHNQLLNSKLQATAVGPKDLRSAMGEGGGPEPGPANAKWLKEGQNQLRRAATAHRDQNRNVTLTLAEEASQEPEMAPLGPKGLMHLYSELELSAHNAANRGLRGPGLIISTQEQGPDEGEEKAAGEAEEDDEEEDEEEEEEDLSSPQGLPEPPESVEVPPRPQALADGPREHSKSASLLFGMRNSAASDEDSSWATLSQGSPSYGSPEDTGTLWSLTWGRWEGKRAEVRPLQIKARASQGQPGREPQSACPQSSAGHKQVFLNETIPIFRALAQTDRSIPHGL